MLRNAYVAFGLGGSGFSIFGIEVERVGPDLSHKTPSLSQALAQKRCVRGDKAEKTGP